MLLQQQLVINIKTLSLPNSRNSFHPCKLSPRCYAPSYATLYIHVHHKINLKLQKGKERDNTSLQPAVRTLISPRKDSLEPILARISYPRRNQPRYAGLEDRSSVKLQEANNLMKSCPPSAYAGRDDEIHKFFPMKTFLVIGVETVRLTYRVAQ